MKSPSIQFAEIQVENSSKQLAIASSLVSTELSTGYSSMVGEFSSPSFESSQSLDESGFEPLRLSASFNVIPYGPRYDSIVQADRRLEQAILDLEDSKTAVLIQTVEQYFAALRSSQDIVVQELALQLAQLELEAARVRFESGAVTASQLTQMQIASQEAEIGLSNARLNSTQALLSLSTTLGISISFVEEGTLELSLPANIDLETQRLQRSDVKKALMNVVQAEQEASASFRENLPGGSISLSFNSANEMQNLSLASTFDTNSFQPSLIASYDFNYEAPASFPEGGISNSFRFSLGLSIPLDASLPDALALANLAIEQAKLSYQQALENASLTINNAEQQLESLRASLAVTEEIAKQAKQTLQITQQRFDLGLVSQLDVMEAELNLKEQALRVARAQDNVFIAQLSYLQTIAINPMEVLK